MQYENLGRSGLKVSRLCLGMMTYGDPRWRSWVLSESEARPMVKRALDAGINFFDTADMYSSGVSEEITGRLLKDLAKREEVVIATKVYFPMDSDLGKEHSSASLNRRGLSRKHLMHAVDGSLKRLGTDYIDLYQIHRWDYGTPIEETMETLNDLVRMGKVRYIGASSMYAWQFAKAQHCAQQNGWSQFISMQNHYNLVFREEEREMIPQCLDMGVGIMVWSPLARGFLSKTKAEIAKGGTKRAQSDLIARSMYFSDNDFEILERVEALAVQKNVTPAQVAMAWVLSKRGVVCPIIGASKLEYLEEAIEAFHQGLLTSDECSFLEELYQPHRIVTMNM